MHGGARVSQVRPGDALLNARTGEGERPTRLVRMHGELLGEVEAAGAGTICAAVGLRRTRTGDTLLLRPNVEGGAPAGRLRGVAVPPPVFFCAVEAEAASQQPALDAALAPPRLEDPPFVDAHSPAASTQ